MLMTGCTVVDKCCSGVLVIGVPGNTINLSPMAGGIKFHPKWEE